MIVDEMHEEHPELLKDQYWEEVVPKDLPYTVASEHFRKEEPKGSAENYKIKEADALYANINPMTKRNMNEDNYADYESVDTPMVERRKNWFSRQLTRMGSMRSSSQYSSTGGLFNRNRQNSVYSSPEAAGQLPNPNGGTSSSSHPKMTFYDKFVRGKSGRALRLQKQSSKLSLNGAVMANAPNRSNRPRIPTPDVVTKEMNDRVIFGHSNPVMSAAGHSPVASGVALMTQQLANTPSMYHHPTAISTADVPVTFLLSPIKELDTGSLNNTLHPNSPTTLQLAQALQASGIQVTGSPSLSRIITVNSADQCDTSVVNSHNQLPLLSMIIPTTSSSYAPADTSVVHEASPPSGSIPSRRRRFEITRKESLNKTKSLDSSTPGSTKGPSTEMAEKRKSDGDQPSGGGGADGKTGEVYV